MSYSFQILKCPEEKDVLTLLKKVGAEPEGIKIMAPKMIWYLIKIKKLTPVQANIIKQEALGAGGEAARAYGAINHSVNFTDLILSATKNQLNKIIEKLKIQAFGLKELAWEIEKAIINFENYPEPLEIGGKIFNLKEKPLIMGILNVTPDSFYNGGKYLVEDFALRKAEEMLTEGADIIDIGGESTRPGAEIVSEEEETKRVIPIIEKISKKFSPIISVDTTKSNVAQKALSAGATIINDISALRFDQKMAQVVSQNKAGVILMHMQGTPKNMQNNPQYEDVVPEIIDFLKERINFAENNQIGKEKIIIDPGIGFGKTLEHNLEIIKNLSSFKALGKPLLLGHSRKSFIGKILDEPLPENRLEGTLAITAVSFLSGVSIFRVHDVAETRKVVKIIKELKKTN